MTMAKNEYLTFSLGDELYAVEISAVQEILAGVSLTALPTAPPYVLGLMNVRGTVSPVIGLREKFGLPSRSVEARFRVVVMVSMKEKSIGLVVDAVTDVLAIEGGAIEPLPHLGGVETPLLKGIVRQGETFAVVLDVEAVVSEPNVTAPVVELAS